MSDEKMRAEFEEYIKDRGHAIDWSSERGVYVDYVVQVAWRCWQVARAELVIDLPARLTEGDDYADGWNHALTLAGGAVRGAGVRVKP